MQIKVKYFGMIAERLNNLEETLEFPSEDLHLKTYFNQLYPQLNDIQYTIAVDKELKTSLTPNQEVREIALLPPFAGG